MAVGVNNFDNLKEEALRWSLKSVERTAWVQIFFSLLTQASSLAAFPSYNVVLGFWGLYCVFTRSLQATQAYLCFLVFSILLDIVYCSIWGGNDYGVFDGSTAQFCLCMLILNMLAKTYSVYRNLHFYKEMEAGNIHRHGTTKKDKHKQERGMEITTPNNSLRKGEEKGGGAYNMEPLPQQQHAPLPSPTGSIFSEGSNASFALSPQRRRD
ncbi:unnamed protein product [Discosporangium mesarthrocarpum]